MKTLSIAILMLLIFGGSLFAQQRNLSEFHYINVPIERIYAHRLGFVVIYRMGNHLASVIIPEYWFSEPAGRGELIMIGNASRDWPSMSVFTREGEFSHVRLRIRRSRAHETWGMVPQHVNIDEHFQGIEEIRLR